GGRTVPVGYTVLVSLAEKNELRWISYGKRAKHDCIEKAEDRCVRTDTEGEREQRHGGESGATQHRTEAVANVLKKIFQPIPTPCHVALLPDCRWITESATCGLVSRIARQACLTLLLLAQIEVQTHLLFEVRLESIAMKQHADAAQKFERFWHGLPHQAV